MPLSAPPQPPYARERQCSLFWSTFKLRNTKVLSSNPSSQGLVGPVLRWGEVLLLDHVGLEGFLLSLGLLEACKRLEKGASPVCLLGPGWEGMRSTLGSTVGHGQGPGCVQCHETPRVRCPGTARGGLGVCCVSGAGWPWGALLRAQNQGLGRVSKSRALNAARPKQEVGSRPEDTARRSGVLLSFSARLVDAAHAGT